jgi:hypothetical protein
MLKHLRSDRLHAQNQRLLAVVMTKVLLLSMHGMFRLESQGYSIWQNFRLKFGESLGVLAAAAKRLPVNQNLVMARIALPLCSVLISIASYRGCKIRRIRPPAYLPDKNAL